ncbi:MAG: terminase large subunit domain-containing protein, partial [Candidatus Limnocylindrus sp.]
MNEPSFSPDVVADVRRLRAFDAQLTAARARFPLATARLWHRDAPRTSQRTAFTSDIGELLHAVLGGMGSGKTEGAIQVAAAMARGRNDLEVQVWARSNGFPLHRIPPAPKLIIVSAASHQLSAVTLRPLFEALMPEGTRYGFWSSKTHEAAAYLPNGCEARFMAETQPLAQFQSMSASFALLDEQHRETVVDSVLQRVTRNAWSGGHGWALLSATPAQALVDPNMAWMHQRLEVEARDGYRMTHIYGSDNPYLDRAARERLLIGMDAAQRRMEDQGSWYSPGGMVFERFDRSI